MNPITHFLIGWTVAETAGLERRRDRALVALAGCVADVDGLGVIAEKATLAAGWHEPLLWWTLYHHTLCHNLGFALLLCAAGAAFATRRVLVPLLVTLSFHLHLLGDIVGARGPDGYVWPIPYLLPFSDAWQLTWQGQWALNAWPNIALTIALLALAMRWAWARGHSPLELISRRADARFVQTLRDRFGEPQAG